MIKISAEDRQYLLENIPNIKTILSSGSIRKILEEIDMFLMTDGFAPPHYEEYNALGRKVQRIYDHIYEDNVLGAEE